MFEFSLAFPENVCKTVATEIYLRELNSPEAQISQPMNQHCTAFLSYILPCQANLKWLNSSAVAAAARSHRGSPLAHKIPLCSHKDIKNTKRFDLWSVRKVTVIELHTVCVGGWFACLFNCVYAVCMYPWGGWGSLRKYSNNFLENPETKCVF